MKIRWHGHSCFSLLLENGLHILTDPFDASVGYAQPTCAADIVTESHQHHDHNDTSTLSAVGTILAQPGTWTFGDVTIRAIPTFHDDENGAKRGTNLLFVVEAEGMRIVHCGDLGHMLSQEQLAALAPCSVLLVPIGGFYTIDTDTALRLREELAPALTIPMHFLTPPMRFPISDEKAFVEKSKGRYADTNEIHVTVKSLEDLPEVLVLQY